MSTTTLAKLAARHNGLRVFTDDVQTRLAFPIASDRMIFRHSTEPIARPAGELLEVIENTLGGKFQLPVETDPQKALAPASGRTINERVAHPLATLEIWSLEPGTYDLVLKLPTSVAENEPVAAALVSRFIDQAQEVTRVIENTDLLRFQSGPALSLIEAQSHLRSLENESGTRLDTESLLTLLNHRGRQFLN